MPWPGRSGAITVWRCASGSITSRQFSELPGDAVDQQQHRALATAEVADLTTVQLRRLEARPPPDWDGVRAIGHALTVARRPGGGCPRIRCRFQYCRSRGRREQDSRPPRGALIVIAIGLFACVAAALLTTDKASGEAAELEWVKKVPMADSRPAPLPGGGTMQLVGGSIRTTGLNVSGYSLFRVSSQLRIDAGAPIGGGRILCSVAWRRPGGNRPERRRPARHLPALQHRALQPGSAGNDPARLQLARNRTRRARTGRAAAPLQHRERRQARMAEVPARRRAPRILPPRRQAEAGPAAALRDGLADDLSPRRQSRLHAYHQRRQGNRAHRADAEEGAAPDRRRSRRRKPGTGRRNEEEKEG